MNKLFLIIATLSITSALSAYNVYDPRSSDYLDRLNRDFDRAQNRMYQEDMIRLQREANQINSSLQNQRGYRYGR